MDKKQISKNNMYDAEASFLQNEDNATILNVFPRLGSEIANFLQKKSDFTSAIQSQQLDITGITQGKNALFQTMVELALSMSQKAYVWASDHENSNLTELFDVHKTDFENKKQNVIFNRVKNIRDGITPIIGSMASVSLAQSDLDALNNAITAYQNSLGTPVTAKTNKTAATQAIEDLMHPIDDSLDKIGRLIMAAFIVSNPGLVNAFLTNKHILALPVHHAGVHATITDGTTHAELSGATLSIVDVNGNVLKTSASDIDGIAEIIKIKAGIYNAVVSLTGYQSQTNRVEIKRGRVVELEIGLVR